MATSFVLVRGGVIVPRSGDIDAEPHPSKDAVLDVVAELRVADDGVVASGGALAEEYVDVVAGPGLGVDGVDGGLFDEFEELVVEVQLADVRDAAASDSAVF